jgi:hypothetical protein
MFSDDKTTKKPERPGSAGQQESQKGTKSPNPKDDKTGGESKGSKLGDK